MVQDTDKCDREEAKPNSRRDIAIKLRVAEEEGWRKVKQVENRRRVKRKIESVDIKS